MPLPCLVQGLLCEVSHHTGAQARDLKSARLLLSSCHLIWLFRCWNYSRAALNLLLVWRQSRSSTLLVLIFYCKLWLTIRQVLHRTRSMRFWTFLGLSCGLYLWERPGIILSAMIYKELSACCHQSVLYILRGKVVWLHWGIWYSHRWIREDLVLRELRVC